MQSAVKIEGIDHFVLTVASIEETCAFYQRVLGMQVVTFGQNRKALTFGNQKMNLHERGKEIEPHAHRPVCGSADLSFITKTPAAEVMAHLHDCAVTIIEGPVTRTGAVGTLVSVYFRDPDLNLVEVGIYAEQALHQSLQPV